MQIATGLDAPALGRAFLATHARHLPPDLLDDALIMVSELITNAVTHGRPDITLTIRAHPPSIGVAVTDHGSDLPDPALAPVHPDAIHGRGLHLINALADTWGIEPTQPLPGKTVWFCIHHNAGDHA